MKTKKFVSVLCACAMLLSALPFASAAAHDPAEHAGQTVVCQVFDVREDGSYSSRMVSVEIPANATQEEEIDLLHSAASESGLSPYTVTDVYEIFGRENGPMTFYSDWTDIAEGTAKETYSSVDVYFSVDFTQTNASGAEFKFLTGNSHSNTVSCKFDRAAIAVVFRMPSGSFQITAGDTVFLNAKTSGGMATITNCILWGWN